MNSRYNIASVLAGMGAVVSTEDNDLNININADHEGNDDGDEGSVADFTTGAEPTVETEPTPAEAEALAADTSGAPETAELDVADAGEGVAETADNIEGVNDVVTGLEGIAIQLAQASTESFAITPLFASSIKTQFDFVTRKYPGLRKKRDGSDVIPSMESWTGPNAIEDQAVVSMESIMGRIKTAGKAIVQFLKDLWERIRALFGAIGPSGEVMKKKAAALRGRTMQLREFTLPSLLTSAPFTAAEVDKITAIVKDITATRLNASALLSSGWPASNIQKGLVSNHAKGTYLGNFKITGADGIPNIVSAEATKEKKYKLNPNEVGALLDATTRLGDALIAHKNMEKARKEINDALIKAAAEEVTPEDAGRYAKWKTARDVSSKWGKFSAFEARLVKKAISVGNAVNNAVASGTSKPPKPEKEKK